VSKAVFNLRELAWLLHWELSAASADVQSHCHDIIAAKMLQQESKHTPHPSVRNTVGAQTRGLLDAAA
jgi:hypothetical protein